MFARGAFPKARFRLARLTHNISISAKRMAYRQGIILVCPSQDLIIQKVFAAGWGKVAIFFFPVPSLLFAFPSSSAHSLSLYSLMLFFLSQKYTYKGWRTVEKYTKQQQCLPQTYSHIRVMYPCNIFVTFAALNCLFFSVSVFQFIYIFFARNLDCWPIDKTVLTILTMFLARKKKWCIYVPLLTTVVPI